LLFFKLLEDYKLINLGEKEFFSQAQAAEFSILCSSKY
jgi:hypothetical protein